MTEHDLFNSFKQHIKELCMNWSLKDEDIFTYWFMRAYVTDSEEEALQSVVNGSHDKGMDSIYIDHKAKAVFIVQAKYRKELSKSTEKEKDVVQFFELSSILGKDNESSFDTYVKDADALVKDRLIKARRYILRNDYKLWMYYITTGKFTPAAKEHVQDIIRKCECNCSSEMIDGKRVMHIYHEYLDGVVPPIPSLDLEMENGSGISVAGVMQRYDKNGEIESWVFPMRGSDIGKLFDTSGVRIFARNIRGFLGKATPINSSMKATLENEPDKFFYYNNGITILCDRAEKISEKGRELLRVNNPQIINGQQTTRTLSSLANYANKASVLVKVIRVPREINDKKNGFESLVSAIVQGTNWQNPVKQSDLIVNDRRQIEIEREFRKLGYLYLRKRQSKSEAKMVANAKYLRMIKKEEIARAVAGCEMDPKVLRMGLENLFSEEEYTNTFPNSDPNYYLPRYWLMSHVDKASHNHNQGGVSKWMVLNFVWSRLATSVKDSKKAISFRKLCENRDVYLSIHLQRAIDKVFVAVKKYYSLNKDGLTFLDFFKAKKGRDKEFQIFWNTPKNKGKRIFNSLLTKVKRAILEA